MTKRSTTRTIAAIEAREAATRGEPAKKKAKAKTKVPALKPQPEEEPTA